MAMGYCTLEDLRRALRQRDLPGDAAQDQRIAVDAIVAQTEPIEKALKRHWYAETDDDILDEATAIDIPTEPKTRDDEEDLSSSGGEVLGANDDERFRFQKNSDALLEAGPRHDRSRWQESRFDAKEAIRLSTGNRYDESIPAYTRIRLARRDVEAINELSVIGEDGSYTDWVASSDYDGGVGNTHRGEDYWVRINNGGWSELYLDVHAMVDDLPSLSNAVYVDLDYGHVGIPRNVRRGVACLAGAELAEDAVIEIPQNATIYNIETKADELREQANSYLSQYLPDDTSFLEVYQ